MEIINYKKAKDMGLARYFNGKPCVNNHLCERYTCNGKCVECASQEKKNPNPKTARGKAKELGLIHFYAKSKCKKCDCKKRYTSCGECVNCHSERSKLTKREWREKNREYYLRQAKDYRERTKQHRLDYSVEYRARTVEQRSEYNKKHRIENIEHYKNYAKEHREKNRAWHCAYQSKRRARKMQAILSEDFYKEVKIIYKKREKITKKTGQIHHVDHIVPLQGENVCGLHVPWNLQIITADENIAKSNNLPPEEQLRFRGEI